MSLSGKVLWLPVVLVVVVLVIQFVPANRDNPPVETEVPASPQLRQVLVKSCYDCHSNETVWPWYSRVAPVSWLVAHDVHEGRGEVNFSTWNRYNPRQLARKMKEIREQVEKGKMPLGNYVTQHPAARLSAADRQILLDWTAGAASAPPDSSESEESGD